MRKRLDIGIIWRLKVRFWHPVGTTQQPDRPVWMRGFALMLRYYVAVSIARA